MGKIAASLPTSVLTDSCSISMANLRLRESLKQQSVRGPLTG